MDESRGRRLQLVALAIALAIGTGRMALGADEIESALIRAGKVAYDKYCTPCHGPGGAPGTAVSSTTKQPVDLRTYVERHGGKFPAADWFAVIVDTRPGGPHAAAWQAITAGQSGIEQDADARAVVGQIARYVMSIQKK